MEETSLDNRLLKIQQGDNCSMAESSRSFFPENRISWKKSRIYILLVFVSIFIIGLGIFVYLLSSRNTSNECFGHTKSNSSSLIDKQTTLPDGQTTMSTFTANKQTTETRTTADCHGDWVSFGQSCYLFSNQSVRWLEAMIRCQNLNSYLVEIRSAEENQFLSTHAKYLTDLYKKDCYEINSARYKGNVNTAYNGLVCQRWDSQTPHQHTRDKAERFPDASVPAAANFCRDPDGEGLPWCYTIDPKIRWKFCDIYECPGGNYWTGIVAQEDKWIWITTQTELGQGYSNWGQGEPQSLKLCGSIVGSLDFKWKTHSCSWPAMYICEKKKN